MKGYKNVMLLMCLLLTSYLQANEEFINKANDAKNRADAALMQSGCGPERHRALITAYWVRPGDTVLDLGAHLGCFSRFYSKLVGQNGVVVAYEASPPIYNKMVSQLNHLAIKNIIPRNRAISDTTGKILLMKIYPNDTEPQSCTVEPIHWNEERMPGNTKIVEVQTESVDDLLENETLPLVRFIKIDTEGHEHAVIRGAEEILLTQRPLVIFEYGFQKGYWEPDTIRQMEELGYVCYDCNTDEYASPGYGENAVPYLLTDLLAIPVELEEEISMVLPYLH